MHAQLELGQPVKGMTFADKLHLYLLPDVTDWWAKAPSLPAVMGKSVAQGRNGGWQPPANPLAVDGILPGNCLKDNLITAIPGGEENVIDVGNNRDGPRAPVDIE